MIFFLNSTNRVYNAKELNKLGGILFSTGIFNTTQATHALWKTAGDFLVEATGSSMQITARAGAATARVTASGELQRIGIQEDSALVATVAANPSIANRNDAVVIKIDQAIITGDTLNAAGSNAISLVCISGNSATALTDSEVSIALGGNPFIRLANILVPQSTATINQAMITDVRTLVKMTRSTQLASDSVTLYALANDPATLEQGMIWLNADEGILKMYNGTNVIALQTESFDWGYYPSSGIDQQINRVTPITENDGTVGAGISTVSYCADPLSTIMQGELFKMPSILNPLIQVKMGQNFGTNVNADMIFATYTVDGSGNPIAQVESFSFTAAQTIINGYMNLYLNGALYSAGTNYLLVCYSTSFANINNVGTADDYFVPLLMSTFTANTYLLGSKSGAGATATVNPLSLTWGSTSTNTHFIMRISERAEMGIGKLDSSGSVNKVSQVFTAKSKDIIGFQVIKGSNVGSPSAVVTASLYNADSNGLPTGSVITSGSISAAAWTGASGTTLTFPLSYDKLVIGTKYAIVIDTDVYSNINYYTIHFGAYAKGRAYRWNTADGWVSLAGDIFFSTVTSPVRKIVITNDQGKIPVNLFERNELLALIPSPIFMQEIALAATNYTGYVTGAAASADGSVIIVLSNGGNAFERYQKDALTGQYILTHYGNSNANGSDYKGIAIVGSFIYVFYDAGANVGCYRYNLADLSNETAMTITTPISATSTVIAAWTDGTFLYVVSNTAATTTVKLSISGTTLTQVTTGTNAGSSFFTNPFSSSLYDGTSIYTVTPNVGTINPLGSGGTGIRINKLADALGAAITSSTDKFITAYSDINMSNVNNLVMIPIDANRCYIGGFYTEYNATATIKRVMFLIPVTKP